MSAKNLRYELIPTPNPSYRPRYQNPPAVMMSAAQDLANVLRQHGLHFAFCEDIATYAYGLTRWYPRSIKIMMLLGERSLDELSESLSSSSGGRLNHESPGIFIYYGTNTTGDASSRLHPFRVQLVPTKRHPLHSGSFIVEGLPLVPFTFVLLEQLMDWDRDASLHGSSEGKQKVVMAMLRYFRSNLSKPYCKPIRSFDPILHADSQARATRFYEVQASYLAEWKKMGFLTPEWNFMSNATQSPSDALNSDTSDSPEPTSALSNSLATSLSVSSTSTTPSDPASSDAPQAQSKSLYVKCTPRLFQLLYDWDNDETKKEEASREIQAFLISIRMGRQTLITGPRPSLDALVHAQVHRYFSENKAFFLQWQKMGFFESYASKYDVPQALPKSDRGYFLPPKQVEIPDFSGTKTPRDGSSVGKVGKTARKATRQSAFGEARTLAAEATVTALDQLGLSCAIFGSMACRLYGSPRLPNDVDILIVEPEAHHTQESIKEMLVEHSPDNFFLQSARDPTAPYRVLHYHPLTDSSPSRKETIKIDILLPGVMNLPSLTHSSVVMQSGLPVVPYSVLLLQKLQAWDNHRLSKEERYTKKVPVDVKDILWLLSSPDVEPFAPTDFAATWSDRSLFLEGFMNVSRERVKSFCIAVPSSCEMWITKGLLSV